MDPRICVTVISSDIEKKPVPNLTSILLEDMYDAAREIYDYESWAELSPWRQALMLFDWGKTTCTNQLKRPGAQKLYNSTEKFDLIISEAGWVECFYGFITKFGSPPTIATYGGGVPPWFSITMGNPANPSYIPNMFLPLSEHMTFGERVYNFVMYSFFIYYYEYHHIPTQEAIARSFFKEELPPFMEVAGNFSLVLSNLVFGLDEARPLMPNIIPIGGMHIKTRVDPLPKDLKIFLDEAKDGFIYFSLGSNLRSDNIAEHRRKALLEAFAELPQRVLWKFESDDLPGIPPNVMISKWLPQSDVLAHPNIKIFVTHCGLMSTTEATYKGVPVVGVPFFMDQKNNMKKLVSKGAAVELNFITLTKESALKAFRAILNDDSYARNMKRLSAIYKDHPEKALDRAVFWTEYVIRHGGAPHLRPASRDLYWYQYFLLDVIFILIAGAVTALLGAYFGLKTIYKIIRSLFKPFRKVKTN